MSQAAEGLSFNRALQSFREELTRPSYAALRQELHGLTHEIQGRGLPLRLDHGRDFENTHVLLGLRQGAGPFPKSVLDVGGGNSPVAYYLARQGVLVTVLDVDRGAIANLQANTQVLGLESKLRGVVGGLGPWPLESQSFDAALSISVVEGILRSKRPEHFSELRRVLKPKGRLLMTFDYGPGARFVSDPPTTPEEVQRDLIGPSGMELLGPPFQAPHFDGAIGPPVKVIVPTPDGFDLAVAEYTFGALLLLNP